MRTPVELKMDIVRKALATEKSSTFPERSKVKGQRLKARSIQVRCQHSAQAVRGTINESREDGCIGMQPQKFAFM